MAEYIATEDSTFGFDVSTAGDVAIVPLTSVLGRFTADGLQTYTSMGIAVTNATNGTITAASGVAVITGGATKVSSCGFPVVLEGDCVTVLLTGTLGSGTGSYSDVVTITAAGQTVAKAV